MEVLSRSEIDTFLDDGYLYYPRVFSEKAALEMQAEIWSELNEEFGTTSSNLKPGARLLIHQGEQSLVK